MLYVDITVLLVHVMSVKYVIYTCRTYISANDAPYAGQAYIRYVCTVSTNTGYVKRQTIATGVSYDSFDVVNTLGENISLIYIIKV